MQVDRELHTRDRYVHGWEKLHVLENFLEEVLFILRTVYSTRQALWQMCITDLRSYDILRRSCEVIGNLISVNKSVYGAGRAGRDGRDANCLVFLNEEDCVTQYSLSQVSNRRLRCAVVNLFSRGFSG